MEETMYEIQLPEHWTWVELKDLTENPKNDIVDGPFGSNLKSDEYTETGIPVFKIQNIKENRFVDKNINFVSSTKAEKLSRHSFQKGDLIITKLGNPLGLCCKVPEKYPYGIIVADLMRFRPSARRVAVQYLMYGVNSVIVQSQFKAITKGTTRPRVNLTIVRGINFPLPPLPEQHAIVSKIEQLFSELDNGIANLKLAQEQLKVYRQAVLKKAFEGELTKKWREQQTDLPDAEDLLEQIRKEKEKIGQTSGKKLQKIKPFTEMELAELPSLPKEWGWERLEGVGYWTGGGTPSKQNHSYWNNGDVLWVSPKDMKTTLIVDTGDKITKESIESSSAKWIAKDSILFVVRSGIIRRVLPIALAGKNLTTNQDLQSLTLFWGDKDYVFWYCQANEQIIRDKCAKDGTTVDNIEVPRLKSYPIAICSLAEQQAIVQEIETRLSVCDKIEQDIKDNLERAEALRQSILKKAFEGKLLNEKELAEVRKAEDWEPAEVLLERIRAGKAGNEKKGKS